MLIELFKIDLDEGGIEGCMGAMREAVVLPVVITWRYEA